jgi:hypothetical protein
MQDSVAAVCNDLSSRDFNVAPINSFMTEMDDLLPQIMTDLKKQGVANPDDIIPMPSWEVSNMIEGKYANFEFLLEIEEVKNLWNSVMEAGQGSFEILEKAARDRIDLMQPAYYGIMKSIAGMNNEQFVRNYYRAMTKLFNDNLTTELILEYIKDVFEQIKPIGGKIDELMVSEDFLKVLAMMNRESPSDRQKRSSGHWNQNFVDFSNFAENMVDAKLVGELAEESRLKMIGLARYTEDIHNVFVAGFSSGNFAIFEIVMNKFEKMINSHDFLDFMNHRIMFMRKILDEITEDESVEFVRLYDATILSQEEMISHLEMMSQEYGRVRRETCFCSGYSGSHFLKDQQNIVGACVGVAGLIKLL